MYNKFNAKVCEFMAETIKEFQRHENQINELHKQLDKKEDKKE